MLGSEVKIAVGHDDGMVVRTAESLDALAMAHAGVLDDVSHWGRTNEGDGINTRVDQDVLDTATIAREHVEHTVGKSSLLVQLCREKRCRRCG